jgi:hypothetical protein
MSGAAPEPPPERRRRRPAERPRAQARPAVSEDDPFEDPPLPPELERKAGLEGTDRHERKLRGANLYRQGTDRVTRPPG